MEGMDILKRLAEKGKFDTIDEIFGITTRKHPYIHYLHTSAIHCGVTMKASVLADLQEIKDAHLKELVTKGDVPALRTFFLTNSLSKNDNIHNVIKDTNCEEIIHILMENGLRLDKINYAEGISIVRASAIGTFLLSHTLKEKIDPNARCNSKFGAPLWFFFATDKTLSMGILDHTENFTQPIDINATDSDGDTILHFRQYSISELLSKHPDLYIKNLKGYTVVEARKAGNLDVSKIEEYIANRLKVATELEQKFKDVTRLFAS